MSFELLAIIYGLFALISMVVSVLQIRFVRQKLSSEALLLSQEAYIKAGTYAIAKEKYAMASVFLETLMVAVWLGGGIAWLQEHIMSEHTLLRSVVMVDLFLLVNYLVTLPLEMMKTFGLDKTYGFTTTTPALFVSDELKKIVLTGILGSALIGALIMIIESLSGWWFYGFLLVFGVSGAIAMLYPTLIAPLFNRFVPLPEGELKENITALLEKNGFSSEGVFSIDAGKRDTRLNAYFGGLGKAKRIALYDTLIEKLSVKEIVAVLGHELGHATHGDIYRQLATSGAMMFLFFYLFGHWPMSVFEALGLDSSGATIVIISMIALSPLSFFVMPLVSAVSRHNEFAADRYGAHEGGADALGSALTKLVSENLSFPRAHPWYIFFHHTHPTVPERLERLQCAQ